MYADDNGGGGDGDETGMVRTCTMIMTWKTSVLDGEDHVTVGRSCVFKQAFVRILMNVLDTCIDTGFIGSKARGIITLCALKNVGRSM